MELQTRLSERTEKGWSWIYLIQEPYLVRGNVGGLGSASSTRFIEGRPKAVSTHNNILPRQSQHHTQFKGRDAAVGVWRIGQPNLENILLISLYWSREALELPKKFLDGIEWAAQNQIPVHMGADQKAHSKLWGSATDTARGFRVEKLLYDYILTCTDEGEVPTFVTRKASTIIDLTIVSEP